MDGRGRDGTRRSRHHQTPSTEPTPSQAEAWKQAEQERHQTDMRQKWEASVAHFVTPGLRPLAEPPLLNWKKFRRTHIFSDLRYGRLFPGTDGKEKRARMKDLKGEAAALFEYMYWLQQTCDDEEVEDGEKVDERRKEFYENLHEDLREDFEIVEKEMNGLYAKATGLGRFEFTFLTNAGKLDRIKAWLNRGANIFEGYGEEVVRKYGNLKRAGWEENPDETLEAQLADDDGGMSRIHYDLKRRMKTANMFSIRLPPKMRPLRYTKLEKKSMWTMPGFRPLAEPPVLDCWSWREYENQMHTEPVREEDSEYVALFPEDPERLRYLNDLRMEEAALVDYFAWAGTLQVENDESHNPGSHAHTSRNKFYLDLSDSILQDSFTVSYEELAFWDEQAEMAEKKRPKRIEDEKKAKAAAELKAKLKAEAAEVRRLEDIEERERAEEEARRYAATWKGMISINARSAFGFADGIIRARY